MTYIHAQFKKNSSKLAKIIKSELSHLPVKAVRANTTPNYFSLWTWSHGVTPQHHDLAFIQKETHCFFYLSAKNTGDIFKVLKRVKPNPKHPYTDRFDLSKLERDFLSFYQILYITIFSPACCVEFWLCRLVRPLGDPP